MTSRAIENLTHSLIEKEYSKENKILIEKLQELDFSTAVYVILGLSDLFRVTRFTLIFKDKVMESFEHAFLEFPTTREEIFVEIYDNPELDEEEAEALDQELKRIHASILNMGPQDSMESIVCLNGTFQSRDKRGDHVSKVLSPCYRDVCVHEKRITKTRTFEKLQLSPNFIKSADVDTVSGKIIKYCFDIYQIVIALAEERYIDFQDIPTRVRIRLENKLKCEIKMVRRYLRTIASVRSEVSSSEAQETSSRNMITLTKSSRNDSHSSSKSGRATRSLPRIVNPRLRRLGKTQSVVAPVS